MDIFETNSRKLEQFLYVHDIHHITFYKNQDGLTTWVYLRTDEVMRVVEEFRQIDRKRRTYRTNDE